MENKIQDIINAGVILGHNKARRHPKMKPYIERIKGFVDIIDAEKIQEGLVEAIEFLKGEIADGKEILIVGTKIQVKDLVREFADNCNIPYINTRWLGGTISNYPVIKRRVSHYMDLKSQQEKGELEKYSNKERVKIQKEIIKLESKFGGLVNLKRIPEVLIILDIQKDNLAVKEAKDHGSKIVAICDTNVNPDPINYIIPGSDDSVSSVKYILTEIQNVISKINPTQKVK